VQAMSSSRSDHIALEDLELFAVVAEELHFGRAAARLHISQPGLSYRVQRLESALGYEVLARTRRSVRLTAAGEVLLEGAQRVLGETSRIVGDGARVARGELATVRVGFVGTALYSTLPALLRLTRERHPDLRLLLEERKTAAQVRGLQLGQLDVGLLHLPLDPDTGLESVPVFEEPVGVALPHDHPLAESDELTLAELADEPFVLFPRELEPHTYDRFVAACVASGFAPEVAHQATGAPTMLGLVAGGVGVAFAAESVAASLSRSGVAFVALTDGAPRLVTGPAWRADHASPAVELLRACLEELAATDQLGGSVAADLLLD
jgi:DNA-binding transcriptional LysR family regulator